VPQLVAEIVSSGMQRSEFCQSRGLSCSTLDRHLKKRRWKRSLRPVSSAGRLVPVEVVKKSLTQHESSRGLVVVLPGGRRIEVHPDFDTNTLERVEKVLPCTPDQRVCKCYGRETVMIGYEESSQLDVQPAKFFVLVTKRKAGLPVVRRARSGISAAATTDHRGPGPARYS
jgi:hypothetical protein